MSLTQLINRDCIIFHRGSSENTDELGNEIPDETATETVGEFQPRTADEEEDQDQLSESDWVGFFLPADREFLDTASAVWVPEVGTFEVVGHPPTWRNPRTQIDGFIQVNLKRTAGPEDEVGS